MARNKAYQQAEEKIAEAQNSGAKELDLRVGYGEQNDALRLTELPGSLGRLTQLQSLNLSNNRLTALPEWLGQLTQLESLNLAQNQLTALPEWLGQLTKLKSLSLAHNQLTALPEWLGELAHLQSLHLSGNQLMALPVCLGQLTQLESLHLSSNQLTALPDSLGDLKRLQLLNLSHNRLTGLHSSIGKLSELRSLFLVSNQFAALPEFLSSFHRLADLRASGNQLMSLPDWMGEFTELMILEIAANQLRQLPKSIARLTGLTDLYLGLDKADSGNPLDEIPESVRSLENLQVLWWSGCGLRTLPDWLGDLTYLRSLHVGYNQLTDLPASLAKLKQLDRVFLEANPLNPELVSVYKEGMDAVQRYLREMAKGGKSRYEAKLLILGDGNEGKTCVSRALRGLPFGDQSSTRGVDVVPWTFSHPDDADNRAKDITLNIWDFEGQEISHQTHQFFLTSQSLYLLVFKCRDQFLIDRAEYWLDTIRARAPQAKVVIVISQCEVRSPHVPLDRIESQYRDMLAEEWFFAVGCENGKNVGKLQAFLQRSAAKLEFMGSPWPTSYEKAEAQIKEAKTQAAHISRTSLDCILREAGVSDDNFDGAAAALARLGVITQFPDCPDLHDFVVLQPPWLTKAISKVMEDAQLAEEQGEVALKRLEGIWSNAEYPGMFATFHDCMKEFELCYDLEGRAARCLVPLRFGYVAPPIPWADAPGLKDRRMEYKVNIRPPKGIMSRFIVKTHHMIVTTDAHPKGIYWHNGVFLRTMSPVPSEALCEFIPDERIFRVQVRAAFPQNMCEQIHGYIQAVFSFFRGLSAERYYGCIKVHVETGIEEQCKGLHTEKRIYTAIAKERGSLDCEFEDHEVDPRLLVGGFSSFSDFVKSKLVSIEDLRRELDQAPVWAAPFLHGIGTLIEWAHANSEKLDELLHAQDRLSAEFRQEAELKLHEYLACTSRLLDDRDYTSAPGLISITTKDRSPWNPAGYFKQTYILTPFCECEEKVHACPDGSVEFTKDKKWWAATAPWIARATKLLAAGLQLAFAGMPLALGTDAAKLIEDEVKFMEALTEHLELEAPKEVKYIDTDQVISASVGRDMRPDEREAAVTRAALARFLEETAPDNYRARRWGSLSRRRMPDNSYRWLCDSCVKENR